MVDHLGGTIVEDWQECSHLITGEIRKTMRCLCVIAAGKPIVSLEWIRACRREQRFVGKSFGRGGCDFLIPMRKKRRPCFFDSLYCHTDETPYLLRSVISRPVFQDKRFFMTEKAPISKSDLRELATAGSGKVRTEKMDPKRYAIEILVRELCHEATTQTKPNHVRVKKK